MPRAPQGILLDLLDPVDDVHHPLVDPLPHQVERPHALALVFHLRVDLRVAAEAHAAPQVVHREEVVLPGVVEDLEEHGPLHPPHLVPWGVATGVPLPAGLDEIGPQLFEITRRHGVFRQGRIEPVSCPVEQSLAVEPPRAVGLAAREVRQAHEHRILNLPVGIDVAGEFVHALLERRGVEPTPLEIRDVVGGEARAEAPLCPAKGAAEAEVGSQESGAIGEVDAVDRLASPVLEPFGHPVTADLLEVAVAHRELPAGVGERRQGAPVPLTFILTSRKVLFDRLVDLPLRVANRLLHGHPLRLLGRHAPVVGGIEFARELATDPRGVGLAAVVLVEESADVLVDLSVDHLQDHVTAVRVAVDLIEDLLAEAIDAFPLLVHHFVVFEEVLADLEVSLLDLLLGGLDTAGHHPTLDRLSLLHAQSREHILHPLTGEDPHQVIFKRKKEPARAGVALATAAAAELEVDAPGLVTLRADDLQATHRANELAFGPHVLAGGDLGDEGFPFLAWHVEPRGVFVLQFCPDERVGIATEDDVGAAAGHVGGDRDGAEPARL